MSVRDFNNSTKLLRSFFESKNFVEVHTQDRLSILAACEDPNTIATFQYSGSVYPLIQTGQMWLEHEILSNPDVPGFFCLSTSYRAEPNPVPGRHNLIFPMFEFETHGGIDALRKLEEELLEYVGFGAEFPKGDYLDVAKKYDTMELEAEHETQIAKDYGPVFFLENFPQYTSPFWNMKKEGDKANKIDVIIHGIETIGSAERSTNKDEMWKLFHTISDGQYADTLFSLFGRERVIKELEEFLKFDFFPRCGGGIGMTRMIRAMKLSNII